MKRCFFIMLSVLATGAIAQQPQPEPQTGTVTEIAAKPPSDGKPIAAVLAEWAKKHEKTLVLEPRIKALVKIGPDAKTFEQGLDLALKPYKEIIWRKLYLREKMEQPKPDRLAAMVRTMVSLESTDIIVQDPKASRISSFVKSVDVPKGFEAGLSKMAPPFGTKCIYVVIDKRPAWSQVDGLNLLDLIADPSLINENTLNEQNMAAIQKMMVETILKMDPVNRSKAIMSKTSFWDALDSRTRVSWTLDAMKIIDTTSEIALENQRRRRAEGDEVMRQNGTYPANLPPPTTLYPSDSEPIATVLAEWAQKFDTELIVEPSLITRVNLGPTAITFEQGLDLAVKPYENITWRKVYLRAKAEQPKADRLAAMVRTIVSMEASGLIVQDPKTNKMNSFIKAIDVPQGYEVSLSKMKPAFNTKLVYVVYELKPRWTSADGINLLDLTADPSCLTEKSLNEQNIKAINQKMIEAMTKMSDGDRTKVVRAIMETVNIDDPRTNYEYMREWRKCKDSMTPEEKDATSRRYWEDIENMREMGVPYLPTKEEMKE